jgi:hypothetical protein
MLLQNISLKYAEPIDRTGDTSEYWPSQLNWRMNMFLGQESMNQKAGVPDGYSPPYSFFLPLKDGSLSSYYDIIGSANVVPILGGAKTFPTITLSGHGSIPSTVSLTILVQFFADLIGSGTVDEDSALKLISKLVAELIGSGEVTDTSILNIIAWCDAALEGSCSVDATMKGFADIAATITSAGDVVTAQSCAAAVWSALAAAYSYPGTMGKALNDAGGSGNPWAAVLASNDDPGTFGELVQKIQQTAIGSQGLILGA